MPNFTANLSFLFTELQFMERFSAAREAGFQAVEFMFPYDYNLDEINDQLKENHLKLVLFNLPSGNWAGGDRGIAIDPVRKEEFRKGVDKAIKAALKFGVTHVNCLVGKSVPEQSDQVLWGNLVENIRYAADSLKKYDINLMVEPINHFDIPGFYLNKTEQVLKLLNHVDRANVYVQYDIYHADREGDNHNDILNNHLPRVGHIQIADNPDRHQPGSGNINFKYLLEKIDQLGYNGYVGMEYIPHPDTLTSLSWVKEYGYELSL